MQIASTVAVAAHPLAEDQPVTSLSAVAQNIRQAESIGSWHHINETIGRVFFIYPLLEVLHKIKLQSGPKKR